MTIFNLLPILGGYIFRTLIEKNFIHTIHMVNFSSLVTDINSNEHRELDSLTQYKEQTTRACPS